ncbi:MAG: hypothetical protein M1828_003368 [Chrysothrix sp. TS-e1954]|nr:MAG: hypothetical protein M1828_003368 [Chrysothrix sp. TS-e1954]
MVQYDNTVITLTEHGTPDPYFIHAHDRFYETFTGKDHVEIWSSHTLIDFSKKASKHVIWVPPKDTEHSDNLWAPELHAIDGRWYVYYAADHPRTGNKSHRMYLLGGPPANFDPCTGGKWEFLGPLLGMPQQWAIDGTVIKLNGQHYFVYSGWPIGDHSESELMQYIYIVSMRDALHMSSPPTELSRPEIPFELTKDGGGTHGINEGPQWLEQPNGDWRGLVYSCAGSWCSEYKMNTLRYLGGDPLNVSSWRKGTAPLLQTTPGGDGPYGPGHGSFLNLNGETLGIYHATDGPFDGWKNRRARCQRVAWTKDGPYMGDYVGKLTPDVDQFTKAHAPPEPPHGVPAHHGLKAFMEDAAQKIMKK